MLTEPLNYVHNCDPATVYKTIYHSVNVFIVSRNERDIWRLIVRRGFARR